MNLKRKINNRDDEEFWDFVDKAAERAANFPAWKRGGENVKVDNSKEEERQLNGQSEINPNYRV